ncbi:nuclear transport factor 2 family protein [Methylobacterium durans]|nr:nuclear transport factor 2 family protein [Methylobacterium durans]
MIELVPAGCHARRDESWFRLRAGVNRWHGSSKWIQRAAEEDIMSPVNDPVTLLKSAYARWSESKGQDVQCWMDLLAEDATLTSLSAGSAELAFTAPRGTRNEILGYLEGLRAEWEMLAHDMKDFVAQGDQVVVIGHVAWRNKATGKVASTRKVDLWRFSHGRAVAFEEFYDTARAHAAATPDPR